MIAVTEHDRELIQAERPDLRVTVIPNGEDTTELQPLPEPAGRPL